MDIQKGIYKAIKNVPMRAGVSAWLMKEGDTVVIEQLDIKGKKALFRTGKDIDWMPISKLENNFTKV